ncbi:MAG: hypothetical protein KF901_25290 [Myxococcales bacterium]|nr:hypothetical protein [Myxococcales bacterium]
MRALFLALSLASFTTNGAAQRPQGLALRVEMDSSDLEAEVGLQLADWEVSTIPPPAGGTFARRAARARAELDGYHAAAWFERGEVETVLVVITATDATPRTSPLPARATPSWERAVALVLDGLLSSVPLEDSLASADAPAPSTSPTEALAESEGETQPSRTSRWPSPLARNGWVLRAGWMTSFSPRSALRAGPYTRNGVVWVEPHIGGRLRVGRWLTRFLRVDVSGHLGTTLERADAEGGVDVEVMVVSSTRLRMGGGVGVGALLVDERDSVADSRFGWVGWWISFPMEIGFDFYRRSGLFIHLGPTWTKAPYVASPRPGMMLSVEVELDFGRFE